MGTSISRRYDPVMRRCQSRLAERIILMQRIETAQTNRAELTRYWQPSHRGADGAV